VRRLLHLPGLTASVSPADFLPSFMRENEDEAKAEVERLLQEVPCRAPGFLGFLGSTCSSGPAATAALSDHPGAC